MTPEIAGAWIRVLRDMTLLVVGVLMLVYATLHSSKLDLPRLSALITFGLCACGLPVALRAPLVLGGRATEDK